MNHDHYAVVICPVHGRVFLTAAEYHRQMAAPDYGWRCPALVDTAPCWEPARWSDDYWEEQGGGSFPFDVPCIRCGETSACISIDLNGLDSDEAIKCDSCGNTYSIKDVMLILESWKKAAEWIKTAKDFVGKP